jgi:hypothetical protein
MAFLLSKKRFEKVFSIYFFLEFFDGVVMSVRYRPPLEVLHSSFEAFIAYLIYFYIQFHSE